VIACPDQNRWEADMQCRQVPGWDTDNCCESCHEDWGGCGIEDVYVLVKGEVLHVCCRVVESVPKAALIFVATSGRNSQLTC